MTSSNTAPEIEALTLSAADGYRLAAHLFRPQADQDLGKTVQIHSATAVLQGIYRKFAQFLAGQGFTVLTFDYRGIGDSLHGSRRDFQGRMHQWGELDIQGVTEWMEEHFPDHQRLVVGHSVGGQVLGLVPLSDRFDGVYGVCSQWATYRNWPAPRRWLYQFLFHVVGPSTTALAGYFPGSWFGAGDLPATIGNDWMRWCRSKYYICDDNGRPMRPHYDRLRCPALWNGFTDDPIFAPPKAIRAMTAAYPNADHDVEIIDPKARGLGPVGHFGFFRSRFRESLWQDGADWLMAR